MRERAPTADLVLDLAEDGVLPSRRRLLFGLLGACAAILVAIALHLALASRVQYRTQPARVGDLVATVTATGTLQPTEQVDIGSELSGTIRKVEVGYNDDVQAGQVLARLDPTRLEAQVLQSEAALEASQAAVEEARANLAEAESQLERLRHVHDMSAGKVPSAQELASGQASAARARGALRSAEALVVQARATLDAQRTDLSKAVIKSPIDGVVLTAAVRPGQTVAASLQAPVLFTLARDLKQLELDLSVDEADVGQVQEGQPARFTVDAWPGRTFTGHVRQVRFGARTIAGVVTYETILAVDNPDLLLRPGMTATAEIEVRRDADVLLVPSAALRFDPAGARAHPAGGIGALLGGKHPFDYSRGGSPEDAPHLWVVRGRSLKRSDVEPLASDGAWTEIAGGALEPGTAVAVDEWAPVG